MTHQQQCLHGVTVIIGNIKTSPESVKRHLQEAGASIVEEAVPSVQFIVADAAGGAHYKATFQLNPQALAVRPSWVQSCIEHKGQVDTAAHALRPLEGQHISVSGFVSSRRQVLAEAITSAGGTFSADLYKTCTHLIMFGGATGRKYDFAKKVGISVVTEHWVKDSIIAGRLLPEEDYAPEPGSEAATPTSGTTATTGTTPTARTIAAAAAKISSNPAATSVPLAPAATTTFPLAPVAITTKHSLSRLDDSLMAGESSRQSQPTSSITDHMHPALVSHRVPVALIPSAASHSIDSVVTAAVDRWGTGRADDYDFLNRVKVHLCGCSQAEAAEQLLALREGAATRYPDLVPHLTHLVVGSEATPAQLTAAKEYLKDWRGEVVGVRPAWTLACKATRQLLPPHPSWSLTHNDLNTRSLQALVPNGAASNTVSEATLGAPEGLGSQGRGAGGSQGLGAVAAPDAPFQGLWFNLAALRGSKDEETEASQLIRRGGGTICTPSTARSAPSHDKLMAVCPPSLPEAAIRTLKGQAPGFKDIPRANYVNVFWLRTCSETGEYISPDKEFISYQPLPHVLPLPDFEHVVIHCTQYANDQKVACERLVKLLGGEYSEKWGAHVTHLIAGINEGPKVGQVRKNPRFRHIQVADASWLRDCAQRGELLSVVRYRPADQDPLEGDVGAGTSSLPWPQHSQPPLSQATHTTRPTLPLTAVPSAPLSQRCPLPLSTQSNPATAHHRLATTTAFNPPAPSQPASRRPHLSRNTQPTRPDPQPSTPTTSLTPPASPPTRPSNDLDSLLDQGACPPYNTAKPLDPRPLARSAAPHASTSLQPSPSRPSRDLDALLHPGAAPAPAPAPAAAASLPAPQSRTSARPSTSAQAPRSGPEPSTSRQTGPASGATARSNGEGAAMKIASSVLRSLQDTDDEDGPPAPPAGPSALPSPTAVLEDATNLRRRSRQASGASLRSKGASTSAAAGGGGGAGGQRQSGNSISSWGPTTVSGPGATAGANGTGMRRSPRLVQHQGNESMVSGTAATGSAGNGIDARPEDAMDAQTGSAELDVVERLEGMFKDQPNAGSGGSEDASQLLEAVLIQSATAAASVSATGDKDASIGRGTASGQKDAKRPAGGASGANRKRTRRANSPASIQMSQQVGYDTSALTAGKVDSGRTRRSRRGAATGGAEDEHEARLKADLLRKIQQTDTNSARRPDSLQQLGLL